MFVLVPIDNVVVVTDVNGCGKIASHGRNNNEGGISRSRTVADGTVEVDGVPAGTAGMNRNSASCIIHLAGPTEVALAPACPGGR